MRELKATSVFGDLLPLETGTVRAEAVDLGAVTSLSPFGDASAFSDALKKAHGVEVPRPGRCTGKAGARVIWFGLREVLLVGPAPDGALAEHAAVVDQSDGWAALELQGKDVEAVLARLVPLDLRSSVFKRGHTARSQVQHMAASITRVGNDRFLILIFRSMAGTLVHEVKAAMDAVAARG